MKLIFIILIVIGALLLLGPIMWLTAKLNKIDPFILDRGLDYDNLNPEQERSFLLVQILRPLFVPLWLETKVIKKLTGKK